MPFIAAASFRRIHPGQSIVDWGSAPFDQCLLTCCYHFAPFSHFVLMPARPLFRCSSCTAFFPCPALDGDIYVFHCHGNFVLLSHWRCLSSCTALERCCVVEVATVAASFRRLEHASQPETCPTSLLLSQWLHPPTQCRWPRAKLAGGLCDGTPLMRAAFVGAAILAPSRRCLPLLLGDVLSLAQRGDEMQLGPCALEPGPETDHLVVYRPCTASRLHSARRLFR